jgi:hypothetical protein
MQTPQKVRTSLAFICLAIAGFAAGQAVAADSGWRVLPLITDGKIDPAWVHMGYGSFSVVDGALRTDCDERGMGMLLFQKEKFGNCEIRVVYRAETPKSNAGVFIRIDEGVLSHVGDVMPAAKREANGKLRPEELAKIEQASVQELGAWYPVHHGYEVQIMDQADARHRTGALYSLSTAAELPSAEPNAWRTMIIMLDGSNVIVKVDGKEVSRFDSKATDIPPARQWSEPKREHVRPEVGYIGLQNHDPGDVVYFKEVCIHPLSRP